MGEEKSFQEREDGGRGEGRGPVNSISVMESSEIHKRARAENLAAATTILDLLRRLPGLSAREINAIVPMRKRDRLAALRLLRESGRIVGSLRGDRKTLSWTPWEPRPADPVPAPTEPAGQAVTPSLAETVQSAVVAEVHRKAEPLSSFTKSQRSNP